MPEQFRFKGNLSQMTLPEVLKKVEYYKVPGVIVSKKNLIEKHIYLKNGKIIFASSNQADDRLGEFLLKSKKITIDQYNQSVQLLKEGGKRQGRIFIEMNVLTPKELYFFVQEQVKAILWSIFNWRIGEIIFQIGSFKDEELIKLSLDIPKAIYEGVRYVENSRFLLNRVGNRYSIFEQKPNGYIELSLLGATEDEKKVYNLFNGQDTLFDIIDKSPLPPDDAAKFIYALFVLDLIKKKETHLKIVLNTKGIQN
jgi:two-component system, OmpR family, response regulator